MTGPRAAIQLIVFGGRIESDIAGVLRDVASAGFDAFEAGNMFRSYGEDATRNMLAATGLTVCGAHFGYGEFERDDTVKAHLEYCGALGIRDLMCSGVSDSSSAAGYRETCKRFTEIGRMAADHGVRFRYHNHAWEFRDLGGVCGMEIIAQETDPAIVGFNVDVYWVWYGQRDPVAFIREHADRVGYYHFKDGSRRMRDDGSSEPAFIELGQGQVDLVAAIDAARDLGATWIVAEQDSTALEAVESARISRNYMRSALGC